jgi:hypothetical protein
MEQKIKAVPIPHKKDDLFVAIITTDDEKTLIAQCTSLILARHLVDLHNGSLTQRALDAASCAHDFRPIKNNSEVCVKCRQIQPRQ